MRLAVGELDAGFHPFLGSVGVAQDEDESALVVEVFPLGVYGDPGPFEGLEGHGLVEDWCGEARGGRGFGPDVCGGGGGDCEFGGCRTAISGDWSGAIDEFELGHGGCC